MKMTIGVFHHVVSIAAFPCLLLTASYAAEPTAFSLIREGNRHVGEEARDRIVQIRSDKSVGSLVPNVWYLVYYDPDATARATEVKFGSGQKLTVKRPPRVFAPITKSHLELSREKLKVDSDRALEAAISHPMLKNLTLSASQMWLDGREPDRQPTWKVRLWAAKLRNPDRNVDIGDVYIDAETGKTIETDLHINRVD